MNTVITSKDNERLKLIRKLLKSSGKREEHGLFVVEGERLAGEVPPELIDSVYLSEDYCERGGLHISEVEERTFLVKNEIFRAISDTISPQGILVLVHIKSYNYDDFLVDAVNGKTPFILAADRLQDPGNLGTLIRTAEAAGVTGVVIGEGSCDLYSPKVVRATMGSIFRVPVLRTDSLKSIIDSLKESGVTFYGAHLKGACFYDYDYTKGCGFLIGNEGRGLSEEIAGRADKLLKIPMEGRVESLNAAMSTAVISYEVLRQRRYMPEN
ncbi:MAG: RNA methyltransferase [Lachnospiraceae bacterium]|nr:RNA methyltransferase [Lachnospiraceae bacterium]